MSRLTKDPHGWSRSTLPVDFLVQSVDLDLNCDFTEIAGKDFLLPPKSEIHSRSGTYLVMSQVELRVYNKFGTEI